jgi:very-short-patch-repair endonuclease
MADTTRPEMLAELAARQYGLVTVEQVRAAGWTETDLARRLAERSWARVRRGVYRSAAAPATWRQRALAACLGPGGAVAVSHRSAAFLHGLVPARPSVIEVVIPYGTSSSGLAKTVKAHRSRNGPRGDDIVVVECIPTTTLGRTVEDLARCGLTGEDDDYPSVPELVDRAMIRCRSDLARRRLVADLEGRCGQGRRGSSALRAALEPWSAPAGGGADPQSVLEAQVLREIVLGNLPRPQLQYQLDLPAGRVYLDFAWPDRRVALEVDGYEFHSGRRAFDRDRHRGNELVLAGWDVLHTTAGQIGTDPRALVSCLSRALWLRS